jgi:hypothetical protein
MLVVCRLAGLSALAAYYAGVNRCAQCGPTQGSSGHSGQRGDAVRQVAQPFGVTGLMKARCNLAVRDGDPLHDPAALLAELRGLVVRRDDLGRTLATPLRPSFQAFSASACSTPALACSELQP